MKRNYLVLIFLLSNTCFAQYTFEKRFGGIQEEEGYSVVQTDDGGFLFAGATRSYGAGNYDFYIIKTEADGDTIWTKTFGGTGFDRAIDIVKTTDGNILIGGYTTSFSGKGDLHFIKINGNGDTLWTKKIGTPYNDHLAQIHCTADSGFVICGDYENYGQYQYSILKMSRNGDSLWSKYYDYGEAKSIDQTNDGGYILCVYPYSTTKSREDFQLVKTNDTGAISWIKYFGGPSIEVSYAVQQTYDGGYIVAGRTDSYGAGSSDFYLLKTNSSGDSLWAKTYGGGSSDRAFTAIQTSDAGFLLGGFTFSYGAGTYDFYLVKTDSLGDTLWTRTYGGPNYEEIYKVQETTDGGYVAIGYTYSFGAGTYPNMYIVKTNNTGLVTSCTSRMQNTIAGYQLYQNYPNPFNPVTNISFSLGEDRYTSLRIYDVLGREITTLVSKKLLKGPYTLQWDASGIPSGVYFYRLISGEQSITKKLIVMK